MMRLLCLVLARSPEPPEEFVTFVRRHLRMLRDQATMVTGDAGTAHLVYAALLVDMAARWPLLALARRWRPRPRREDLLLRKLLVRRAVAWRSDRSGETEIEVWAAALPPEDPYPGLGTASGPEREDRCAQHQPATSAVRLAPYLLPVGPREVGHDAEATVAWMRASEDRRRVRLLTKISIVVLLSLVLLGMQAQYFT